MLLFSVEVFTVVDLMTVTSWVSFLHLKIL